MRRTREPELPILSGSGHSTSDVAAAPKKGDLIVGGNGAAGDVMVRDPDNAVRIQLDAGGLEQALTLTSAEPQIRVLVNGATGSVQLGGADTDGKLTLRRSNGAITATLDAREDSRAGLWAGGGGCHGHVLVRDSAGVDQVSLSCGRNEGKITVHNAAGASSIELKGGGGSGWFGGRGENGDLLLFSAPTAEPTSDNASIWLQGKDGSLTFRDGAGREVLRFADATLRVGIDGNAGTLMVRDAAGREVLRFADATLRLGIDGNAGTLLVRDAAGRKVVDVDGAGARIDVGVSGHAGVIAVRDSAGRETIRLDGADGDILLTNGDCAEEFDFVDGTVAAAGTVVVIDADERLAPCAVAYDRRVAGVVSGAGRFRPAIVLDRRPGAPRPAVAMIGKVECNVDANHGPIRCGDLLVSSPTPGHAMAATDPARTAGAVLGKALRGLESGTGRVPILVCLQ